MKPIKNSQLSKMEYEDIQAYLLSLDNDLRHLYGLFQSKIDFQKVEATSLTSTSIWTTSATFTNISCTTYATGTASGINATVSYVDTLLGAKTLIFKKGILVSQA